MHSPVFTAAPRDADPLASALRSRNRLVVGLCAAWCGTCKEFAETFADLAASRTGDTFVWLDIEDDAALAGDIDVENFPTIAVYAHDRLVHFGVSLPHRQVVARLLTALDADSATVEAEDAVRRLPERLRAATQSGSSPSSAATN